MRWYAVCRQSRPGPRARSGLDKTGTLTLNKMHVRHVDALDDPPDELLVACALCNDASAQDGGWIGDPTETALMDRARAHGIDIPALRAQWPRCHEWPSMPSASA